MKLTVEPGDKLKIGAVEFSGAEFRTDKELAAAVRVKKGGAGGRFGQVVSNATLEDDRVAIQEAYHQQGFPFVVVGTAELVRMEDKPAVRVVFPVEDMVANPPVRDLQVALVEHGVPPSFSPRTILPNSAMDNGSIL